MSKLAYRRILLKLSGEALMGDEDYGIDPKIINRLAREVIEAQQAGAEVALVIGGGNIFRGAGLAAGGMDRVTGDQMACWPRSSTPWPCRTRWRSWAPRPA